MSLFYLLFALLVFSNSPSLSFQQNLTSFSISASPWRPADNKILLSPNSTFAAAFLPLPNSSTLFTFSIWYFKLPVKTIIWSAPTSTSSPLSTAASLVITPTGQLRLLNDSSGLINLWPGSQSMRNSSFSLLSLQESGRLVFGNDIWDSFDYPTDTFLPTQNITVKTNLVSRNGKFSFENSSKLVFISDSENYYTTPSAFLQLRNDGSVAQLSGGSIISADFSVNATDRIRRLTLDDDGVLRIYSYDQSQGQWFVAWQAIQEVCQVHGICGPNAICMPGESDLRSCVCPPGFRRNSVNSDACDRKIPLSDKTKFLRLDYVNFTGGLNQSNLKVRNFTTCETSCLRNKSCQGFMFKYDGQGYCVLQLGKMPYGYWSPGTETAMFLRVDAKEQDVSNYAGTMTSVQETTCPVRIGLPFPPEKSNSRTRNIAIICTLFAAELISGILFFWAFLKKYITYRDMARTLGLEFFPAGGPKRFTYAELKSATNDFSNAIGKGGFGDVYKGELTDKRIVAVKCLKHVTGGDAEFWAEVTIIARMHHLNLVRLWGFCAEKGQRILVYEYVPNGSLDRYLFPAGQLASSGSEMDAGPVAIDGRQPILDWGIRYRIALGVARAIAYLHEECLEWVLHCDIKPENILLGDDFCPKISDFGLAKLRKKEDMVSLSRIRGTRGYMAPEWVKSDPITPKADVYSFGMVLLELVTGSRNFEMQGSMVESDDWYFPRWAFDKVFKEMKVDEILDRKIKHCYDERHHFEMVDRMVKSAMWCLQDRPEARPSMGKVAKMLEGSVEITEPKKPTIFFLAD
ncbi:G-type lectin S-receptor-like serine/threonine-protein kinase At1g34300 [Mercurialis annua]|uniref:G-type lectin S-receptor-like serine/threonine-protein kinase At1g34300 n=1 Tax=Mercurialis annua TaxID=3986 RepID=UPI00216098C4|nr:G-type lectin S-receptor-like serine/threonine-protein kinase At1g34300 [Mercurialis annua]